MNKVMLRKIFYITKRYISTMLTMFALYVGCYALISGFVFDQFIFPLNYLLILFSGRFPHLHLSTEYFIFQSAFLFFYSSLFTPLHYFTYAKYTHLFEDTDYICLKVSSFS